MPLVIALVTDLLILIINSFFKLFVLELTHSGHLQYVFVSLDGARFHV